jgi:hypothetical protein
MPQVGVVTWGTRQDIDTSLIGSKLRPPLKQKVLRSEPPGPEHSPNGETFHSSVLGGHELDTMGKKKPVRDSIDPHGQVTDTPV